MFFSGAYSEKFSASLVPLDFGAKVTTRIDITCRFEKNRIFVQKKKNDYCSYFP